MRLWSPCNGRRLEISCLCHRIILARQNFPYFSRQCMYDLTCFNVSCVFGKLISPSSTQIHSTSEMSFLAWLFVLPTLKMPVCIHSRTHVASFVQEYQYMLASDVARHRSNRRKEYSRQSLICAVSGRASFGYDSSDAVAGQIEPASLSSSKSYVRGWYPAPACLQISTATHLPLMEASFWALGKPRPKWYDDMIMMPQSCRSQKYLIF